MSKLFVGNLSWGTNDESLTALFSQVGTVVSAKVITDRETGKARGFGFVEMSSQEEAEKAKELNGTELDGRAITVTEARPQENRDNRGGGGGSYNRGGGGSYNRNDRGDRGGRRDDYRG